MPDLANTNGTAANPSCCLLCGRPLNVELDPLSGDCGGDCWGCIGLIESQIGGDLDSNKSIGKVAKEIAWGWREKDGSPKTQTYFLADNPSFIKVRWLHDSPDDPVELWSELNNCREEVRKFEVWRDGRVGCAIGDVAVGGTRLGEGTIPQLDEIATNPEFEPVAVSRFDFQQHWEASVNL